MKIGYLFLFQGQRVLILKVSSSAWIPNTELTPLDTTADSTQQPSEKGKTKLLLSAYAKAAEAHGLDHFRKMLADHHKALEEDLAEKEEREAEREAKKAKKNNRKSSDAVAVGADVDEMDIDSDEGVEKPKPKKRKKGTEDEALDEKVSHLSYCEGSEIDGLVKACKNPQDSHQAQIINAEDAFNGAIQ